MTTDPAAPEVCPEPCSPDVIRLGMCECYPLPAAPVPAVDGGDEPEYVEGIDYNIVTESDAAMFQRPCNHIAAGYLSPEAVAERVAAAEQVARDVTTALELLTAEHEKKVAAAVAAERERIALAIEAHRDDERVEHLRIPPGSISEAWTSAAAIARNAQ